MKKGFLILFIATLLLSCLSSLCLGADKATPDQQKDSDQPPVGPGYQILKDNIGLKVDAEGKMTQIEEESIQILNKKGIDRFGQIIRPYNADRQAIEIESARLIQPDGKSREMGASQIQDNPVPALKKSSLYSSLKVKTLTWPDLKPGCTIEYRILTKNTKPYPQKAFWETSFTQDFGFLMETSFFVEAPEKRALHYFAPGYKGSMKPRITTSGGMKTLYWQLKKMEPIAEEIAMPPLQELASRVIVSSFDSWNDVGALVNALIENHLACDDAMKDKMSQILGNASGEEKIKKIYSFVSRDKDVVELNYGLGGYDFNDASACFKEKYLASRDCALLLLALLRAENIEAYPVLVSSQNNGRIYEEIPSIQQFDNVIIVAYAGDKAFWLEPADGQGGIHELSSDLQGRPALIVKKDRTDFGITPGSEFVENREEIRAEYRLLDDGSLEGSLTLREYGINKMQWLKIYNSLSEKDRPNIPRILIGQINPLAYIINHTFKESINEAGPFSMQTHFRISDYATKEENGWTLKLPLLSGGGMKDLLALDPQKRLWPIVIGNAFQEDKRFHIILPETMTVKSMPKDILLENDYSSFQVICTSSGSDIWYYSRTSIKKGVIPKEDMKGLQDILRAMNQHFKETIILEKRKAI
jgi:hypothetical protein